MRYKMQRRKQNNFGGNILFPETVVLCVKMEAHNILGDSKGYFQQFYWK